MKRSRERGSAIVETSLILIPVLLGFLGVEELGRALWAYHTVADAVKRGARFAAVHGSRCVDASDSCPNSVGNVAQIIQLAATGLDPSRFQLTLSAGSQSLSCDSLAACSTSTTIWPASPNNGVGRQISIVGKYTFPSAMSSLWPGQASSSFVLAAKSTEGIEF